MSEVISSFRSLRTGSRVFALLMLFLCVILHTIALGKTYASLPLVFVIVCHQYVKILLAVCILLGMVV